MGFVPNIVWAFVLFVHKKNFIFIKEMIKLTKKYKFILIAINADILIYGYLYTGWCTGFFSINFYDLVRKKKNESTRG